MGSLMCAEAVTARKTATRWHGATKSWSLRSARRVVTTPLEHSKLLESDVR